MSLEVETPTSTLRALAHPLRLQILSLLTGTAMSAAELARELDVSQANASYHLRVLAGAGHVVEAGEVKIRGGVAKRYRHPWDAHRTAKPTDPPRERPTPEDHRMYVETLVQELVRRQAQQVPGKQHMTDAEMWVTPEVWEQVLDHVSEASRLIHSQAQPPRSAGTVHVNLSMVGFRMGDALA